MTSLIDMKNILNSVDFKENYQIYKSKIGNDLILFLDSIDTNRKYYRIGINKNQRFRKVVTKDTQAIKDINSLINKLTDENYEKIKNIIFKKITGEYIIPYIIENLVENSILHHIYIPLLEFHTPLFHQKLYHT